MSGRDFWFMVLLLGCCLLNVGCARTQYVPVETVQVKYKVKDSIRYDSIYVSDSVFIHTKSDTVFKEKFRYLYKYMFINRTDTVMRTDSIRVPYPVERTLSRWEQAKMDMGGVCMGIVLGLLAVVVWLILKRRRG